MKQRLLDIAQRVDANPHHTDDIIAKKNALAQIVSDIDKTVQNLARAETDELHTALANFLAELNQRKMAFEAEISQLEARQSKPFDRQNEVNSALELLNRLTVMAAKNDCLGTVTELFQQINVRLFLRFHAVQNAKRILNKIAGGEITLGSAPPPVNIYEGPTSRKTVKLVETARGSVPGCGECIPAQIRMEEENSPGNVSRSDKTPVGLFVRNLNGLERFLAQKRGSST